MYVLEVVAVLVQLMDWRVISAPVATVAPLVPKWKFHVSLALIAIPLDLHVVLTAHQVPCALPRPLKNLPRALKVS